MDETATTAQAVLDAREALREAGVPAMLPAGFTITYHAGALGTEDNSLDSIRTAVAHGAQIVEFDVSFRPDGTPVIIHNSRPGPDAGALLADALAVVAESASCKINLDLKSTRNLPAVDRLVRAAGLWNRVFYTGVSVFWVPAVRRRSGIPYYLNFTNPTTAFGTACLIALLKLLGACGLNAHHSKLNAAMTARLHRHGLLVSEWTVNELPDMMRVLPALPDNITTRRPDLLEALLAAN